MVPVCLSRFAMLFTHGSKEDFRREKKRMASLKSARGYSGFVFSMIGLQHYRIFRLGVRSTNPLLAHNELQVIYSRHVLGM